METVFQTARDKMGKSISSLKGEYAAIRANRATAAVLDRITVDYYGTATPINQLAAISVVEARILCIQPWDASTLHPIEKAIQTSDLGINPQNDGKVIRLTFPTADASAASARITWNTTMRILLLTNGSEKPCT